MARPEPGSQNQLLGITLVQFQGHKGEVHTLICNFRDHLFFWNCSGRSRLSQVTGEFVVISKVLLAVGKGGAA